MVHWIPVRPGQIALNHRMAWIGRVLKDNLVPAPCPGGQGHLPLSQVTQLCPAWS